MIINDNPAASPYDLAQELNDLLVGELTRRVQASDAPAEVLGVARALLKQNGVLAESPEQVKALRDLHDLLTGALHAAVSSGTPTASMLAEVRHFLRDQGVGKDLSASIDHAAALQALDSIDLPFQ
ncbi:hypothetical protein [Caldimonas sp. KR1-144]|uniref:hypothetical protein n=1 Tax=Caldimonas sp. KR1-144 TaxID=3400911 RepID=UPI003BFB1C9C